MGIKPSSAVVVASSEKVSSRCSAFEERWDSLGGGGREGRKADRGEVAAVPNWERSNALLFDGLLLLDGLGGRAER